MSFAGRLMYALTQASRTFRAAYANADPSGDAGPSGFGSWEARRALYDLYWAFYQNTVYSEAHAAATSYKAGRGLYKFTRGVYNPAYRLVEQWQSLLMGGMLDPNAGDGEKIPSCLPILTDSKKVEPVRPALARLWRDSHLQINKGILTRYGSAMGDVGIKVCDEPGYGMVYLEIVHPGTIAWASKDRGFVKEYDIVEVRADPRPGAVAGSTVQYTESARRDGDRVVYATYLNDSLYPWNGRASRWEEPYGFTPLVLIQHNAIGMDWGLSELHSGRVKIDEVNDLGSKLHDQVRKMTQGAWYFAGATATDIELDDTREGMQALFGPEGSKPESLVADLDIAATSAEIRAQLDDLEDDYPELRFHRLMAQGQISGEAIRRAQQPVVIKAEERRPNYDHGLNRAFQMAVAIGGWRGYDGYAGFNLDSYAAGLLDFRIGPRPVFAVDELDVLTVRTAKYLAIKTAVEAGVTQRQALLEAGYPPEDVESMLAEKEAQAEKDAARQAMMTRSEDLMGGNDTP